MDESTVVKGGVLFPCCADESNLSEPEVVGPGLTVRTCVCGRRHFEAEAAPGVIGVEGKGL